MDDLTPKQRQVLEELCATRPGHGLPITRATAATIAALESRGLARTFPLTGGFFRGAAATDAARRMIEPQPLLKIGA